MITRKVFLFLLLFLLPVIDSALQEVDRVKEYEARMHTWPPRPEEYVTEGWRTIFERRFRQLDALDHFYNSYNGYMGSVHAGLLCPNFTEFGWGLTKAPKGLIDELKANLYRNLAERDQLPEETAMREAIDAPDPPLFIYQNELNLRALQVLQPIAEAWSGKQLVGSMAYGLRVYRNESTLNMHYDRSESHIISSILHVGHDEDSEPWPIVIEGLDGATNEVTLEEGDMLLYESSKCAHGRPIPFNGTWYSSLFIHYYPVDWEAERIKMDAHYRVPPIWMEKVPSDVEDLQLIETSMKEPQCEHSWCALKDTVKYSGPAEAYGRVISSGGVMTELAVPPEEETVLVGKSTDDGEL